MAEEGTEELADEVPAPYQPESSEVAHELAKHDVTAMAETRADALSEVLSVSSVEENFEETREAFMEGEEISYEMAASTVATKEPTMVGLAEDHQSEEEEEEIFLEVTEPSVPGQEVTVEMSAADVWMRPHTRAFELAGRGEVGQVDVGPEEFVEEAPRHEEIQPALVAARKEAPKVSLVKTQEAVMTPMKIVELTTEDIEKEVSKESLTQVELDKAAAELPKPSLVSIQEQVRFTDSIPSCY